MGSSTPIRAKLCPGLTPGFRFSQQQAHYHPFGLRLGGLSYSAGTPNRWKYNGKELHDEMGLNWYDYGARMYEPGVGRWNGVDALASSYTGWSPYNYVGNRPITGIDPDGRDWIIVSEEWNKETQKWEYNITFKAAVMIRGKDAGDFDKNKLLETMKSQIASTYSMDLKGATYNISAELRYIDSKDELSGDEHLISFADEGQNLDGETPIKNREGKDVYHYGFTPIKGANIYLNTGIIGDILSGKDNWTVPHEVGHTGGLWHPDDHKRTPFLQRIHHKNELNNNVMSSANHHSQWTRKKGMQNPKFRTPQRSVNFLQMQIIMRNIRTRHIKGKDLRPKNKWPHINI